MTEIARRIAWHRDYHLLVSGLLASVLVYGYAITHFALHLDLEIAAVYRTWSQTLAFGRWGTSLVHSTILPEPFVPFFTPLLSLALVTLAAVATQELFEFRRSQQFVFTLCYVGFPQFAYQLEFLQQSDCVALGILLASLAYVCLRKSLMDAGRPQLGYLSASVVSATLGISFYQSIVFVIPTICTLFCLQKVHESDSRLRFVAREYAVAFGITVVAFAIYSGISQLAQHHYGIKPVDEYLFGQIGWLNNRIIDAIPDLIGSVLADVAGNDFYGNSVYRLALTAALVIVLRSILERRTASRRILTWILVLASLASPFVIVIVLGGHQEPRTFVSEQIAFAGLAAIALKMPERAPKGFESLVPACIVSGILLAGSFHVSRLFFSDTVASESDRLLGDRMVQEIYRAYPDFQERLTPVYWYGAYTPPNVWVRPDYNVFGRSYFSWRGDRIMSLRIDAFLKASGIADLKLPTEQQIDRVQAAVPGMPSWPNPNSIRLIGDVMLVKMSE